MMLKYRPTTGTQSVCMNDIMLIPPVIWHCWLGFYRPNSYLHQSPKVFVSGDPVQPQKLATYQDW